MLRNVKIFLDKKSHFIYNTRIYEVDMVINSGLMTIEDLAVYLKVTRRTIYEWLKTGKIPAVKLIGQWRFRKDKIDDWIEKRSLN